MNRETIKSFILAVLVGLSFLLSYILWSYQPKYEMFYDSSYINEVDVGGKERKKNDLIKPAHVIFHRSTNQIVGFKQPSDEYIFYKELSSWSLTDFSLLEFNGETKEPVEQQYIEVIFPSNFPIQLLTNIFSVQELNIELPNWTFDRFYIIPQENAELTVQIYAKERAELIEASIEKSGAFQYIDRFDESHPHLQPYLAVPFGKKQFYIPESVEEMEKKTLVANQLDPELFINVLFSNPSLVKPSQRELFFTDGQRGMRLFQEGRYLEFIQPIETNEQNLDPVELIDKSIDHINEHKGWINEYHFEAVDALKGEVEYRLHYDGVPVYDFNNLSTILQIWREQELYQYHRSLLQIGHLLNSSDVELPSGEEVIRSLEMNEDYNVDHIKDIRLGYYLKYIDKIHSLTLEPTWFMHYEDHWLRIPFVKNETDYEGIRGD